MTREIVSTEEIREWCNKEIQKFDGCEEIEIAIQELREPDGDGLYWTYSDYALATGVSSDILRNTVRQVIANARQEFNTRR